MAKDIQKHKMADKTTYDKPIKGDLRKPPQKAELHYTDDWVRVRGVRPTIYEHFSEKNSEILQSALHIKNALFVMLPKYIQEEKVLNLQKSK